MGGTRQTARMLRDHLFARQAEMVQLLAALARAESPSRNPAAQQPVLKLLQAALLDCGFRVRHIPGRQTGGHLLAVPIDRPRGVPIQLLLGHCDTVWPLGTLLTMPVEERDGKLYGPGVFDMKAGLVQAIFALDALRRTGIRPDLQPVVLINSDEEIGSPESTPYIRRLAKLANRVFVMEPALGAAGKLKTARKGVGRFTIHVIGRAAHAGLDPGKGVSAILELTHVVQALFAMNDAEQGITVNVGTIDGGLRPNVVAPEARAEADVRVPTQADARRIEAAIHALQPSIPGCELRITGSIARPPLEQTPGNQLLWEAAREIADQIGLNLESGTAGGASDGNTTSQFAPTLDGLGAVGDGAHAVDEHVQIDRMPERAALLSGLLSLPVLRPHSDVSQALVMHSSTPVSS